MENARVIVIEDQEDNRMAIADYLEMKGHEVVAEATNVDDALSIIDKIADGDLAADVILLDGNLRHGALDYEDAKQIYGYIQERDIATAVLGFSAGLLREQGIPVKDTAKLGSSVHKFITEL